MRTTIKARFSIASAILLSMASFGVAHADTTTITNTGPNSTNIATINNTTTSVVTNVNTTVVTNTNNQTGTSGSAQVNGNTTGGGATSGNVTNTNSFGTVIAIANGMGGATNNTAATTSNIAGSGGSTADPAQSHSEEVITLPKTGGNGIDTSLFNALYKAPKGVFAPLAKTGSGFNWALTALAAAMAIGAGYAYDQYKKSKAGFSIS